jgi:hypothetical protein
VISAWHLKWRGKKDYRYRLPPRTQFQPQCWSLLSAAGAGKRSRPCHSSAAATVVASRTPHFAIIGWPGSGTPPQYAPVAIARSASGMASFRGSRRKTGSRTSAAFSSGGARSSTGWASRSRPLRSCRRPSPCCWQLHAAGCESQLAQVIRPAKSWLWHPIPRFDQYPRSAVTFVASHDRYTATAAGTAAHIAVDHSRCRPGGARARVVARLALKDPHATPRRSGAKHNPPPGGGLRRTSPLPAGDLRLIQRTLRNSLNVPRAAA